jgi:serine/threonine protein kinase
MKKFNCNILDQSIDRAIREEAFRDINNLRKLNHPNIVKIEDLVKLKNSPVVIMELFDGSL